MDSSLPIVLWTKSLKKSNQGGTHHEKNCYECRRGCPFAHCSRHQCLCRGPRRKANFVDSDGNGVCDYYGTDLSAGYGVNFTDTDGDGACDYYGTGCGAGFTDSDGDGVCDYYGTGRGAGRGGRWA